MNFRQTTISKVLASQNVTRLHHANSVLTACEFLRSGALLSRKNLSKGSGLQTAQKSDVHDKLFGVWNDIFTDSDDNHRRAHAWNVYGPVLFVFDLGLLTTPDTKIWVAKENPYHWRGDDELSDRKFTNVEDLTDKFRKGRFDHSIVFKNVPGVLPFGGCLKEIVLDDPKLKGSDKVDLFSMAYGALRFAMSLGGINVRIRKRRCDTGCKCIAQYQFDEEYTEKMFKPAIKRYLTVKRKISS
ncbi:hypothetical protein [Anatilimnocola floriformis]|uniref:hypothetical protein n=1 Tax=Anatilimnocola floriformis TaxID=2948575 RepID=UPI0020C477D4|nr:hypothetical protein [Anatilimnocola floriformis]